MKAPAFLRAAYPIALAVVAGCTTLRLDPADVSQYRTLGLMVIASAQKQGDSDERQRRLVRERASTTATSLLRQRGFMVENLGDTLPQEHAFDKLPGSFNINEHVIAEHARARGLPATLILFYYYTGEAKPQGLDVTMYYSCAFYAWVIDSKKGEIKSGARAHHLFEPLRELELSKEQAAAIAGQYDEFLRVITLDMLKDFGVR